MQTNDLKALTIPEGNVLSVYGIGGQYYPVANTFNPDDYEKETEAEIVTGVLRNYKVKRSGVYLATITLTAGTVGTGGYYPILYDRTCGVVTNTVFGWEANKPERTVAQGKMLYPLGIHQLDMYVITPEQKIIGPTTVEVTAT